MGQGRENSKKFLHENPEIREKIRSEILEASGIYSSEEAEGEKPKK